MATQFERFITTMKKVLMLDQADLDFGIYRIMNQKRTEIERYLNNDLKNQVASSISMNASGTSSTLEQQLQTAIDQAHALGVNPETLPKVQQLRQQIAQNGSSEDLENEVYSHLTTFFSRYYDGGDFISQRRYKKDVYAIPYEGEEVKLHWANADQYYIKTGEYFRNYRFSIDNDKYCEFTLKEVTVEQNNNLAQNNMERRFAIYEEYPVELIDNTLHINFTYELMPKTTKQKQLLEKAYEVIKNQIPSDYALELFVLRPTESDRNRTLLQKHLNDYVARNTFDYFIHKDLNGFLTRELDFYIKNEILMIDDINARSTDDFLKHLTVIKAIKSVGTKLITFLASLENYQKRLWLKKKFVVQSDYCITLDRVPEELYPEICTNDEQREEWIRLFAIDDVKSSTVAYSEPLSIDFLKENQFLVVDTKFFSLKFRQTLLASIHDIDFQCDGTLICSENFQALNLMQEKYKNNVDNFYYDPPYNTSENSFIYKNQYKHSSWNSMLFDRILMSKNLMSQSSTIEIAIDDLEHPNVELICDGIFGIDHRMGNLSIEIKPSGRTKDNYLATSHEYIVFYGNAPEKTDISFFELTESQKAAYKDMNNDGVQYKWRDFLRTGGYSTPEERPNSYYPIYFNPKTNDITCEKTVEYVEIFPIDSNGAKRVWRKTIPSFLEHLSKNEIQVVQRKDGSYKISIIDKIKEGFRPKSLWYGSKYDASSHGTKLLQSLFGESKTFSFPKSIYAVKDTIYLGVGNDETALILDIFAGSGTTGHAVIELNRDDKEHRKYILVEMGDYFDTVTKPRIQKVIYSKDWKDGKPVLRDGISHCFKYIRLEQYEDTLNNLVLQPSNIDASNSEFYGGYMLGYLLDIETKDSLFNLQWFRNPWNMKLKVTRQNEQKEETIDMVETFNYLIGLNVGNYSYPKTDICTVEGVTRSGEKTLVIWRNCDKISNEDLNDFFKKMAYSTRDEEFDRIYVNGDNNLENLRAEEDQWKVILIEEEFSKRMFEDC